MDYINNWMGNGPYQEMSDDERLRAGCLNIIFCVVAIAVGLLLCALLGSCTTTKYVTVPEVHEHWHHSTDTIHQTDSIIDHQTTTIREVDSATMARYGIQLKDMQRAWLIESDRLRRELSALRQTRVDTIHERDSIPVPYPVEVVKEVEKSLTWWQQTRLHVANIILWVIGLMGLICIIRLIGRRKNWLS